MCNFFSFVTEPEGHGGQRFFFTDRQREDDEWYDGAPDSHSTICEYYGLNEDRCNKYEYNPDTKKFEFDRIGSDVDDSLQAEDWVRSLNFMGRIIPDNRYGIKYGDVLQWRPLDEIHNANQRLEIEYGWGSHMDDLVEQPITVGYTILNSLGTREKFFIEWCGFSISKDMLVLPN